MLFKAKGKIAMSKTSKFTGLIESYINTRINDIITPSEIITAVSCTAPTAYAFIKNNSHRFEKISAGKYRILAAAISQEIQN
jgi:hypothetical protein